MIDALKIKSIMDLMVEGDYFLIEIPKCFTITTGKVKLGDVQPPKMLEVKKTDDDVLEIRYLGRR